MVEPHESIKQLLDCYNGLNVALRNIVDDDEAKAVQEIEKILDILAEVANQIRPDEK